MSSLNVFQILYKMVLCRQEIICYQSSIYLKVFSGLKPSFMAFQFLNPLLAKNIMKPMLILYRWLKTKSYPDYAPVPKTIRNDQPMSSIAEPQIMPNLIDVLNDDSNYIFSSPWGTELAAKESTSFVLHLNTFEDEEDDFSRPCGSTTFNESLDGSNDFTISRDGSSISDKTSAAQNITPGCNYSELSQELPISEANKNPSYDSEIPILHHISSSTSCRVPPDVTRFSTFMVKSTTYSTAPHSADESTFVYASAQQF